MLNLQWKIIQSILKQYVSDIFSFCDNCDYKYTLLSPIEWEELERVKSELERQDIAKENQALTAALAEGVEFKVILKND